MALDQGTTSSRCILFDENKKIVWSEQEEFPQHFPKAGWVEHDPMDILHSSLRVMHASVVRLREFDPEAQVRAIGITNQRETVVVWDRESGKPLAPAIVWQCRRTADAMEALKADPYGEVIRQKTGLIPDAYFSASKIAWLLEHVPGLRGEAQAGNVCFGTVDSWLVYNLSNEKTHAMDVTNASRTMLFNIHTRSWDPELLEYFNIPAAMLPEVKKSSDLYGTCRIADLMLNGVPICGVAGDQQSALFGQGCLAAGQAKNTYGTGCFLLMNTGEKAVDSQHRLLTTMAAQVGDTVQYALEGSVFMGGACVQWLRDSLGLLKTAAESETLAESVPDTLGAYLVPAFTGLGAPYWDPYARGALVGMTRGFRKEHLVRATLESIAYQVYDVVHAMEQDLRQAWTADAAPAGASGAQSSAADVPGLTTLKVDGGASANRFLMQFEADILGRPVVRPECIETTALGAALLAGLYVGFWDSEAVTVQDATADTFLPKMEESVRAEKLNGWKEAVQGVIHGA